MTTLFAPFRQTHGAQIVAVLTAIWEAAGYPWSARLQALLPWAKRRLAIPPTVERQMLMLNPSTIDRIMHTQGILLAARKYSPVACILSMPRQL